MAQPLNDNELKMLEKELSSYKAVLRQAADTIVEQGVSDFPILVLHKKPIELGLQLVDRAEVSGDWSVSASTVEEFFSRQIILPEKAESFRSLYESHTQHLCLFVVTDNGANFAFLPR